LSPPVFRFAAVGPKTSQFVNILQRSNAARQRGAIGWKALSLFIMLNGGLLQCEGKDDECHMYDLDEGAQ
jgi:hypothetical protein